MREAIGLWEAHSERPLFVNHEPRRRMPVDLVFDERQALSNEMRERQQALAAEEQALQQTQNRYFRLLQELEADTVTHELAREEYNRLASGESETGPAGQWDSEPNVRDTLRSRPRSRRDASQLRAERERLEEEQRELNRRITALNEMAAEIQQQVENFNSRVTAFNESATGSSITAGGYSFNSREGRRITIYRANDYPELVLVIAHELGHALGLGHVAHPDAVMHEDVSEITLPVHDLTEADAEALRAACGG